MNFDINIDDAQKKNTGTNSFTFAQSTNQMEVFTYKGHSLFLSHILEFTKNLNEKCNIPLIDSVTLKITYIDKNTIHFKIDNLEACHILREPFIAIIKGKKFEIVCQEQLEYFGKKYYKDPKIYCFSCEIKTDLTIRYLGIHENHSYQIFENENEGIELKSPNDILNMTINRNNNFLNIIFNSPKDFDENFEYYFGFSQKQIESIMKEEFEIYDDETKNRFLLVYEFTNNWNFGKKNNYFGASGKGKSITILGALKYNINFEKLGSLYVNCKTLKFLLEKENYSTVKKILLDEIIYLFHDNYSIYTNFYDKIISENFLNNRDFWPIIDTILEECSKLEKQFIIGFDQYEILNDPNNYLKELEDKYLIKNEKFKFIVISSMNETDIRQQKIKLLFEEKYFEKITEIQTICESFKTNFDKNEYEAFSMLGKTFKAFNEISIISKYKSNLKKYINGKKKKYLFKLLSFYSKDKKKLKFAPNLSEEEIMDMSEDNYTKFLSFKLNHEYSESELKKIIENIPFKYFNIKKIRDNYYVETAFSLIDEILKDIYKYLIMKNKFYVFKTLENEKGSAYSTLFEYRVRYNFEPNFKNEINYFSDLFIQGKTEMNVIIPKENQNSNIEFIQILDDNKTYLIEQKQIGGKDLDFLIINMGKDIEVFGFQVSTYKEKIFQTLEKTFDILLKRLKIAFKIDISRNNVYFGYIFDYSRIDDPLYRTMLNNCQKYNMKYSFFNVSDNCLYKDKKNKVFNIYQIVGKPLVNIDINTIINLFLNINIKKPNPSIPLNEDITKKIIKILQKEKNINNIKSIEFIRTQSNIYYDKDIINIAKDFHKNIIICYFVDRNLKFKFINQFNNNLDDYTLSFPKCFDIYEIIKE